MPELSGFNRLVIGCLVIMVLVATIHSIRKRELSLSTGVLWMFGGILALVVLAVPQILTFVTTIIGAKYPASALTLYAFLFFATMLVILSSKFEKAMFRLTQIERQLAMLDRRIRHLELEPPQTEPEGSTSVSK